MGGLQNVHVRLLGGRGGQNPEKKLLHSLWMPPKAPIATKCKTSIYVLTERSISNEVDMMITI